MAAKTEETTTKARRPRQRREIVGVKPADLEVAASDVENDAATKVLEDQGQPVAARTPVVKDEGSAVFYVSKEPETTQYNVGLGNVKIRGAWDRTKSGRVVFRVPSELHDRFKQHQFVKNGRIVLVRGAVIDVLKAE